jgi:hypothetical protein
MASDEDTWIEAKVAQVLNPLEIALNKGATDGVEVGDQAQVMRSFDIIDPDSQESLGVVWRPVIRLRVEEVQDRLCIARSAESYRPLKSSGSTLPIPVQQPTRIRMTEFPGQVDDGTRLIQVGSRATIKHPESKPELL